MGFMIHQPFSKLLIIFLLCWSKHWLFSCNMLHRFIFQAWNLTVCQWATCSVKRLLQSSRNQILSPSHKSHKTWSYFRSTIEQYVYDPKVKERKKVVPYQSSPSESLHITYNLRLQSSSEEFSRSAKVLEDQCHIRYPILLSIWNGWRGWYIYFCHYNNADSLKPILSSI